MSFGEIEFEIATAVFGIGGLIASGSASGIEGGANFSNFGNRTLEQIGKAIQVVTAGVFISMLTEGTLGVISSAIVVGLMGFGVFDSSPVAKICEIIILIATKFFNTVVSVVALSAFGVHVACLGFVTLTALHVFSIYSMSKRMNNGYGY